MIGADQSTRPMSSPATSSTPGRRKKNDTLAMAASSRAAPTRMRLRSCTSPGSARSRAAAQTAP
jgi:hypothetical protein